MALQKLGQVFACLAITSAICLTGVTQVHASGKTDSSKNEKHGDGGRAMQSAEKQIAELQAQIYPSMERREKVKIEAKIKKIRETAQKKAKGEEHGRRGR